MHPVCALHGTLLGANQSATLSISCTPLQCNRSCKRVQPNTIGSYWLWSVHPTFDHKHRKPKTGRFGSKGSMADLSSRYEWGQMTELYLKLPHRLHVACFPPLRPDAPWNGLVSVRHHHLNSGSSFFHLHKELTVQSCSGRHFTASTSI
jgi:hypothetical protein